MRFYLTFPFTLPLVRDYKVNGFKWLSESKIGTAWCEVLCQAENHAYPVDFPPVFHNIFFLFFFFVSVFTLLKENHLTCGLRYVNK